MVRFPPLEYPPGSFELVFRSSTGTMRVSPKRIISILKHRTGGARVYVKHLETECVNERTRYDFRD